MVHNHVYQCNSSIIQLVVGGLIIAGHYSYYLDNEQFWQYTKKGENKDDNNRLVYFYRRSHS